jgi:aminoglycoside/choline kinase family phosphotransferase
MTNDQISLSTQAVAKQLFGATVRSTEQLPGGASLRRYHRATLDRAPHSLLIMDYSAEPKQGEEATKGGVSAELPFVNVQRYFRELGAAVPEIYRVDDAGLLLYLEDLGDVTFESKVLGATPDVQRAYYERALDQLFELQQSAKRQPDTSCIAFHRRFDFALLRWELEHFREYGLEAQNITLTPAERSTLDAKFDWLATELAALPQVLVHRDYQSRNLMVSDAGARGPLRIIDFQDALLGPPAYDTVGLLRDSYVELPADVLRSLIAYAGQKSGAADAFERWFYLQAVQRKLKDAGRFVFIDRVKKNPSFLPHIPASLRYVADALEKVPELASVTDILRAKNVLKGS